MPPPLLPPFAGWSGPRKPKMLIVGEAWGQHELQTRQPFVGPSGIELWRMLGEALPDIHPHQHEVSLREAYRFGDGWVRNRRIWLDMAGISYTNVLNLRPHDNKIESLCCRKAELPPGYSLPSISIGHYLQPEYLPEVDRLMEEIDVSRPNCIVAAGNSACWALLKVTNISAIRGTVTTTTIADTPIKVLPTYHPAAILRQWNWRPITVADIIKAYRESAGPELVRPERQVLINPTLHNIISWKDWLLASPPPLLAVDVETKGGQISCIGFAWSRSAALTIPFLDQSQPHWHYWSTHADEKSAWLACRDILESPIPKLFQNGTYDLQYIIRWGVRPKAISHDTMLLHHSLYPEMRKGLGFLGSIYTNESAWKLLGRPKADTTKRDE